MKIASRLWKERWAVLPVGMLVVLVVVLSNRSPGQLSPANDEVLFGEASTDRAEECEASLVLLESAINRDASQDDLNLLMKDSRTLLNRLFNKASKIGPELHELRDRYARSERIVLVKGGSIESRLARERGKNDVNKWWEKM